MRKPRLNKAVATVAVETVFSLLRVASVSFVMVHPFSLLSFRGDAKHRTRNLEVPGSLRAPERRVNSINRRLLNRRAEAGFEEIKIAAFIGLLDVSGEHPAITAFEPGLRLFPFGAALCQLR